MNIALWLVTTGAYFVFSVFIWKCVGLTAALKRLGLVALLCLPVNVNGYVFTVLGNAVGEKGVYSVCSVYQESEKGSVVSIVGLTAYQKAKRTALIIGGVVGFQQSDEDVAVVAGIAGFQKTMGPIPKENRERYPKRSYGAGMLIGVALYQVSEENCTGGLAIVFCQKAEKQATVGVGGSGYQRGDESAATYLGVSFYQRSGKKTRMFGAIMPLKAEKRGTIPGPP